MKDRNGVTYFGHTRIEKAYGESGGALWVVLGNRSGGNRSDWRRVYKFNGVECIKYNGLRVRLDNFPNCMVYEIMEDGEVRDR